MPGIDLPYLNEPKPGFLFYRRAGKRTRIHYLDALGNPVYPTRDDPEALARAYAFTKALVENAGAPIASGTAAPARHSVAALVDEYRAAPEFVKLAPATKRSYEWHLAEIRKVWGSLPAKDIQRKHIIRMRNGLASTPAQADMRVRVLSRLIGVGMDLGYRDTHPGRKIGRINTPVPYRRWPAAALAAFEKHAAPRAVDALMLLRYSGQRIGDTCAMRRVHIVDGRIRVVQDKTDKDLLILMHPRLVDHFAGRTVAGFDHLLVNLKGKPWTTSGLSHFISDEMERVTAKVIAEHLEKTGETLELDFDELVPHGIRKNAVGELLEVGNSVAQTAAVTGQSFQMVEHYAKEILQKQLADEAIQAWWENAK